MREVNECQAVKEWSSIKVVLTEQEELLIAEDFANKRAKAIACWLTGYNTALTVKSLYQEYRKTVIGYRQEREWKEANGAQWDVHRGKFVAHI